MIAFAEATFRLAVMQEGVPLKLVLEGLLARAKSAKRRAELEKELDVPPPPRTLIYLFDIFNRLRRRKGSAGFGPSPIEWPDIDAFCRHTALHLSPWEVEVIEDLDNLFLVSQQSPQKGEP